MPRRTITSFGKNFTLSCDGRCNKAWGINGRNRLYFMRDGEPPRALEPEEEPLDRDDFVFVRDSRLGEAPGPGETATFSEGGHLKPSRLPLTDAEGEQMNKWCSRECERSVRTEPDEPVVLPDFEHPRPNRLARLNEGNWRWS